MVSFEDSIQNYTIRARIHTWTIHLTHKARSNSRKRREETMRISSEFEPWSCCCNNICFFLSTHQWKRMPPHHSLLTVSSSLSSFDNSSSNNANSQTNGAVVSGTTARGRRLLKVREEKRKREYDRLHNYPAWAKSYLYPVTSTFWLF